MQKVEKRGRNRRGQDRGDKITRNRALNKIKETRTAPERAHENKEQRDKKKKSRKAAKRRRGKGHEPSPPHH